MKRVLAVVLFIVFLIAGVLGFFAIPRSDKSHLIMAESYAIGPVPDAIRAVTTTTDYVKETLLHPSSDLPGYDDMLLFEDQGFGLATATDGHIWKVDLKTGASERLVHVPLVASGAVKVPGKPDVIYACSSRLYGEHHPDSERVGVYEIHISTKEVLPVLTDVLIPPDVPIDPAKPGIVYKEGSAPKLKVSEFNASNSRPLAFCNDLAISPDAKRIYITTPYSYEGAAMGGGAFGEAITLARNGLLWRYNLENKTVELIARDFNFIDGILTERSDHSGEDSVLITETTKFRIDRLHLRGPKAGTHDVLWEYLPGMPDGLDRDSEGRIWVGIIKKRTGFITWAHRARWIKFSLLNFPQNWLPIPRQTAVLALSADASTPLFFTEHDGSGLGEISAVIPGKEQLYLANFRKNSRGFYSIPYPKGLQPQGEQK